jgi:hypothetical protein
MTERAARGEPFLSGMFTRGEVVYADAEGGAASHREPIAIFTGEVLPQYASDLDELAGEMGRALQQEEIHFAYQSDLDANRRTPGPPTRRYDRMATMMGPRSLAD